MFIQQLKKFFLIVVIIASILLTYLWYQDYSFSSNPLSKNIQNKIYKKHQELRYLTYKHFKIKRVFPIIIKDNIDASKFGMTIYSTDRQIKIDLKRMKSI